MVFFGKIMIEHRYRLRWRFDLPGQIRTGVWNNNHGTGQREGFGSNAAWCVNKTGLVRAAIEGEMGDADGGWTGKTITLAECDGWDFVNFAWIATTPAPFMLDKLDAIEITGQVTGLTLETRDFNIQVRVDGTKRTLIKTDDDKRIHLAGFGR